jgi:DNA adenine methylase
MKTPISYYGGKQQLASRILGLIPEHRIYCEPFLGGAAIFFAKEPSPVEIINDTNGELINFYEVVQRDFSALEKEVAISLHSRRQHHHAQVIYDNPEMFDRIKRAWAVWMLANSSYGCMLNGGYGYDRTSGATSRKLDNKRNDFTIDYAIRLQRVQIECCDALKIIRSRDTLETFFYCDPPYPDTDQGHYDGYSSEDFRQLLEMLSRIKGKFLLSSFRHETLKEYTEKYNWSQIEINMNCKMGTNTNHTLSKIEVLTGNYQLDATVYEQKLLFDQDKL